MMERIRSALSQFGYFSLVAYVLQVGMGQTAIGSELDRRLLSPDAKSIVFVDIERLQTSETARLGWEHICQQQVFQDIVAAIPTELRFVMDAELQSVTLQVGGFREQAVVCLRGHLDLPKLRETIRNGAGYSQVEYQGMTIHHWLADPSAVRDAVGIDLLSSESDGEVTDAQPAFLAELDGQLVYSSYLVGITETIDRFQGNRESLDEAAYAKLTESVVAEPIFVGRFHVSPDQSIPGLEQLRVVIGAGSELEIDTEFVFGTATQAALMANVAQPSAIAAQVNAVMQQVKAQAERRREMEAAHEQLELSSLASPDGVESEESSSGGKKNRLEFGLSFDGESFETFEGDVTEIFEENMTVNVTDNVIKARWKSLARIEADIDVIGDGISIKVMAKTFQSLETLNRWAESQHDDESIIR